MKSILIFCLLFSTTLLYGQEKIARNTISINPIMIITFLNPVLTYERTLNTNNSLGIDLGVSLADEETAIKSKPWHNVYDKFTVRPFYRYYFNDNSNKIFIEPHLNIDRAYAIGEYEYDGFYHGDKKEQLNKLGFGISCGLKKENSKQFIFQIKIGMMKDFLSQDFYEKLSEHIKLPNGIDTFGRISVGKRF